VEVTPVRTNILVFSTNIIRCGIKISIKTATEIGGGGGGGGKISHELRRNWPSTDDFAKLDLRELTPMKPYDSPLTSNPAILPLN